MHFFMLDKDNPGELVLRFPWFPHWMVHNPTLMQEIHKRSAAALPDITMGTLSESHYAALDEVVIAACLEQCPYVVNLEKLLRAILETTMDETKAPKLQLVGRKVPRPPGAMFDPLVT